MVYIHTCSASLRSWILSRYPISCSIWGRGGGEEGERKKGERGRGRGERGRGRRERGEGERGEERGERGEGRGEREEGEWKKGERGGGE